MIALEAARGAAYLLAMALCTAHDYRQNSLSGDKVFTPYHCFSEGKYKVYLLCPEHGPMSRVLCVVHHAEAQQEGQVTHRDCGLPVAFLHALELKKETVDA